MESLILMVPRPFKIERIKHMSKLEEKITLFKNQNSNRSAEELLNLFDNTICHYAFVESEVYGKMEMSNKVDIEDVKQEGRIACINAAKKFNLEQLDGKKTDKEKNLIIHRYFNMYIDGAIKRYVERENHVSHHYAHMLLHIKKNGHNLLTSDKEDLIKDIFESYGKKASVLKNPDRVLSRLEAEVSSGLWDKEELKKEATFKATSITSYTGTGLYERLQKIFDDEELDFFIDYFLNNEGIKYISKKYGLIRNEIKENADALQQKAFEFLKNDYLLNEYPCYNHLQEKSRRRAASDVWNEHIIEQLELC